MYIVANWKMYLPFKHAVSIAQQLKSIEISSSINCIICPSFESLSTFKSMLQKPLYLGAQDCSSYSLGAYTGQVSAQSLSELGCAYCIIGHSELRQYAHQTDNDIALKMQNLFEHNITPIVCIGETQEEHAKGATLSILEKQLRAILTLQLPALTKKPWLLAYEPIWSIGTGVIPSAEHLIMAHEFIRKQFLILNNKDIAILYGGSISPDTIDQIAKLKLFDGFLIGKASTDAEQLSAIMKKLHS